MKNLTLLILLAAACSSDNKAAPDAPVVHETDAAIADGAVADCFAGTPQTHDQLINACVDQSVTRIVKHPNLPLLNTDGSLPPLP